MQIDKVINEYKICAEICSNIDYSDKISITANNKAVTKMYKLLNDIKIKSPEKIDKLYHLLDDQICSKWFAHQLLELFIVDKKIEKKAIKIIKNLSKNDLGEKYWLKKYKKK
jgi:hypothetical protein